MLSRKQYTEANLQFVDPAEPIDKAFESGLISDKERILEYANLLFDRNRLRKDFKGMKPVPLKSGTTILQEIIGYTERGIVDEVSEKIRGFVSGSLPELDKAYVSPSGYFRIHYTLSGENAVAKADYNENGVPDYIESTGIAFDYVKRVTCDQRGFREPVPDKEAKYFEVYVYDLKGVYGLTRALAYNKTLEGTRTASGRISIDNDYSASKGFTLPRDECMRVTAAHEFFHAVQFAYNVDADKWWKEASATWNEDEIYSSVNDYVRYIGDMFNSPEKPLVKKSYSGVVFAKYLTEHLGGYSTMKRVWDYQRYYTDSLNAIDAAVKERIYGEDAGSAFNAFTACNFNPPQYYSEGSQWKYSAKIQQTHDSYPVTDAKGSVDRLSSRYYLFKAAPGSESKALKISVETRTNTRWGVKIQKKRKGDLKCETSWLPLRNSSRAEITINSFADNYDEVCLIPANLHKSKDGAEFSYSATLE